MEAGWLGLSEIRLELNPAVWLCLQQLSQWREEKEKEALKAAVLDTQAAAKFSTAAALASKQSGSGHVVDWRDNTLASASPPRDQHPLREVSRSPGSFPH